MFKVCLMGASFDTGNQGVSALAASLVELISGIRPDARISFFIGARSSDKREIEISGRKIQYEILNHRLSPRSAIKEHLFFIFMMACLQRIVPFKSIKERIVREVPALQGIKEADFVGDIRGGDSFSDIYGLRRTILGSLPSAIAIILGKRLFLLPQTYGPYRSWVAKKLSRWILRNATCVLSRDREGVESVKAILKTPAGNNDIQFCPDVAFGMAAKVPPKLTITPSISAVSDEEILIGLNINGLLFNGGYTRDNMFGLCFDYCEFVKQLSEEILEKTSAHLMLIPHTFAHDGHIESDPQACNSVFKSLKTRYEGRIHLVEGCYDQFEIKSIIGECQFFIGSRMHACIGAISQGIPTVGIAYSDKFKGVFESVGLGKMVLDARCVNISGALKMIFECLNNYNENANTLSGINLEIGRMIDTTFRKILS
jgi:colanic acid/amylovoran biosynthesis protein